MKTSCDVAVIGLGAMGSAATYLLAKRGASVIGFDRFLPPHREGSTHGESRIIREAYFEQPFYVPIVQRAYELWHELEGETGTQLLLQTGGLMLSQRGGALVEGTRFSADRHGLDYEMMTAKEIRKQFPALQPGDDTVGIYEPRSGVLLAERCVEAHLARAAKFDVELHMNEPVAEWSVDDNGVTIRTEAGEYTASKVVLTLGPWMSEFRGSRRLPLTLERQVLYWFEPAQQPEDFTVGKLPIFAWEYDASAFCYGVPYIGAGVKFALHHQGEVTDLRSLNRVVDDVEVEGMRLLVRELMPALDGPLLRSEVCIYTNTPDEHFVIDTHPDNDNVIVVSACSGHGFKFSSVIGEAVTDLAAGEEPAIDLSPFRISRFMEDSA